MLDCFLRHAALHLHYKRRLDPQVMHCKCCLLPSLDIVLNDLPKTTLSRFLLSSKLTLPLHSSALTVEEKTVHADQEPGIIVTISHYARYCYSWKQKWFWY